MGLQDFLTPALETLHQAIGLRPAGRNQAVFDGVFGAELIEGMSARRVLGGSQEPIGEPRPVVGQAFPDAEGPGLYHGFQEGLGI